MISKARKCRASATPHLVAIPTAADPEPVLHMNRWQCNSCHVPQVDAKPLVENSFQGRSAR